MKNIFILSATVIAFAIIAGTASFATNSQFKPYTAPVNKVVTAPKSTIKPGQSIPTKESNCPVNTYVDSATKMCVDGTSLYALFSDAVVNKCIAKNGGKACTAKITMLNQAGKTVITQRYNYKFYQSLIK
jgi:curli biogenesis system outer membrane secretion channel CsgG